MSTLQRYRRFEDQKMFSISFDLCFQSPSICGEWFFQIFRVNQVFHFPSFDDQRFSEFLREKSSQIFPSNFENHFPLLSRQFLSFLNFANSPISTSVIDRVNFSFQNHEVFSEILFLLVPDDKILDSFLMKNLTVRRTDGPTDGPTDRVTYRMN